jgi:hypothetical protein
MPLPTLLIIASLVAAVMFFLAGLLLAPRRAGEAASRGESPKPAASGDMAEDLRRERAASEAALTEAQVRCLAVEKERDAAQQQVERLLAKDKTLAERLRAAEAENRAAFEREEKVAEAWAGQLDAAKAEQKREDQGLHRDVGELRAQVAREKAEREELAKLAEAAAARERSALERAAEAEAVQRAQVATAEAAVRAKVAETEAAMQAKLVAAEAAVQAKVAETEAAMQAKLAAAEAARQTQAAAAKEVLRARLTQVEAERAALGEQLTRGQTERAAAEESRQEFELRMRAAEEVVEVLRVTSASAQEALRAAEGRAKDREQLARENAELRAQRAQAEQETKERAGRDDEAKDAKVELAAAQAKLAELERVLEENRRLRDEVAELRTHQEASGELERLTAAHKQVRLDAELMARRLQELLHDQAELVPLRAQAAEAVSLAEEVEYLRRREKDLEAQLYASGSYSSREMPALSGELSAAAPVTDLETNLSALVGDGGPRTAVLADAQGFLIASAGESVAEEGLAAFAAVAGEMVARARMLLPLADVDSVRVTDANRMVLTCHLFASAGEGLGIATLGPGEPKAESTARAIAGLTAIVSGGEAAEDKKPAT